MMRKAFVGLAVLGMCALVGGSAFAANNDIATQGYFAILFCEATHFEAPPTGWTEKSACDTLASYGIEPLEGWDPNAELTEGVMVYLLRFIDIPIYTNNDGGRVTVKKAIAVLNRYKAWFVVAMPVFQASGESSTTTAITASGNPQSPVGFN